ARERASSRHVSRLERLLRERHLDLRSRGAPLADEPEQAHGARVESEPAERARDREGVFRGGGRVDVGRVGRIDGRYPRRVIGGAERRYPATDDLGAPPIRLRRTLGPELGRTLEQPERLLEAAGARRAVGRRPPDRGPPPRGPG